MSKARGIMERMLADESGAPIKAVRTTQFMRKDDGSAIQKVIGEDGSVLSETVLTRQQCLSLDARVNLGLSQQKFADLLGISVRTLHDWEQGRREPSGAAKTLLKIAALHPEIIYEVMEQQEAASS